MKRLALILIVLLLAEFTAGFIIVSAFSVWRPDAEAKSDKNAELVKMNLSREDKELQLLGRENKFWVIDEKILASWASDNPAILPKSPDTLSGHFLSSLRNSTTIKGLLVDEKDLGEYLIGVAAEINRLPQDALLKIENDRAVEFVPDRDGLALDLAAARESLLLALTTAKKTSELPIHSRAPKVRLSHLNNLGVKTLLARGQSDFSGSSASRIQNIKVGSSQYRGVIIKPDEEFSFNSYLGLIDAAHGYKPELVIKPEGTVPEFGGGLCQVSSTAFRAAFFSGLPITQRRNHSYAVRYYDWISDDLPRSPGLDATIYPGAQDMKFINDTPGAILVWTEIAGTKLYFDFYGTADGREIIVDGPHPYDRTPDGAVKSKVARKVIMPSGQNLEVTFNSRYVSPNLFPKIYEYPQTPTSTSSLNN